MKIFPLKTGTIHCNKSIITLGRDFDQWIDIPSVAWLVETSNKMILVDTGMCDSARADRYHYSGSCQKENERIDRVLDQKGYSVDDIDMVIFTHLHWDHCSNCDLFRKATFYIQKREIVFARDPIPPYYHSYESAEVGLKAPFQSLKFEVIDGDCDIAPGIRILTTFGHSPGHQSVQVTTERGRYVIAGDAIMSYENLERDDKKGVAYRMIGRYMDFEKTWRSLEKITAAADFILPSHDDRVFEKSFYA
ncbi:MAG: N-acyl homoserine lactonase family protein [Deltaproteobacteria bacterium]|nr:N-acyl homoserine lactonase family protein [Deltaproteobacteria bacterium]MBI2501034.1 N-acyl homoserine lactonase family protein [Deltaproteobacteria bacterium]